MLFSWSNYGLEYDSLQFTEINYKKTIISLTFYRVFLFINLLIRQPVNKFITNKNITPKILGVITYNYDKINLPNPYPNASIWLIGPKIDLTFNKNLFWSTFIQYSNQQENLGINTRLQWRFAPLSDLFIVYNDNYFPNNFGPKFRSLNLKLTYWLNI